MNPQLGSSPRSAKGAFFITDGFLLLIAFLISWTWDSDTPAVFAAIVACVLLAAVIGILPFILDWIAAQREATREQEARVGAQIARLEAATESLARAAAQVQAVESAVHKVAKDAENLPYRMQEKLAEFNEALAEKEDEQRNALEQELAELRAAHSEQLKSAAAKIRETVAELSALEKNARGQAAAADAAAVKLAQAATEGTAKLAAAAESGAARLDSVLQATLTRLDERIADLARAVADKPPRRARPSDPDPAALEASTPATVAAVTITQSSPGPELAPAEPAAVTTAPEPNGTATLPATSAGEAAPADGPVDVPKPKKPRAPRKPRPEDVMAALSGESAVALESAPPFEVRVPDLAAEATPKAETSSSADGATRLLATAYIGIGNKLFIRGDGPGLSWDAGVPMQFVSIGKWGWSTQEATGPVTIRLYKNDETPALSGEIVLEPGKHTEATALF